MVFSIEAQWLVYGMGRVLMLLRATWPYSVKCIPNSLPAASGTTIRDSMSCFLFWLASLPLSWFPVHKIFVREGSRFKTLLSTFWKVATSLY
ncbi:hypothetical protein EV363DRAFT_1317756 [Boletus edulis]|nr:hypothetical protein EV363DRAFT_1317756 [Boletus edulis]